MTDVFIDMAAGPREGHNWIEPSTRLEFVWVDMLAIWVGKYMVTNEQFRAMRPEHDSGDYRGWSLNEDRQPAVRISFLDAMAFATWVTDAARQRGVLPEPLLCRVPSDREWTACARCGDGREYPWGDEWPPSFGNFGDASGQREFPDWEAIRGYDDGHPVTCRVEEAGVNALGLYGIGGNAYEWTFEAEGTETALRGGSFSTHQQEYLKIDNRLRREPSSRLLNFGCRLVLVP